MAQGSQGSTRMDAAERTHDQALESLLDEALAPEAMPTDLPERLVHAGVRASVRGRGAAAALPAAPPAPPAPLVMPTPGRSHGWPALAAAAVIALTMLGVWSLLHPGPTAEAPTASDRVAAIERELSELEFAVARGFDAMDPMDDRIELLSLQLELTQASPLWPGDLDPLDEAASDIQAQRLMHELDLAWAY